MNAIRVVARREFRALMDSKAFLFGTIIGILAIVGLSFLPTLIGYLNRETPVELVVVDAAGGVLPQLDAVSQALPEAVRPNIRWVPWQARHPGEPLPGPQQLAEMARERRLNHFLYIARAPSGELQFTVGGRDLPGSLTRGVPQVASPVAMGDRAARAGLSPQAVRLLQAPAQITFERVENNAAAQGSAAQPPGQAGDAAEMVTIGLSWFLMFALYMTLILYGSVVSNGVAAEKGSRVVEMLLVAATPGQLLRGKLLGIAGASLVQYGAWAVAGGLTLALRQEALKTYLTRATGIPLELGSLPLWMVGYLALFFLLGFFSYGALFAASASLASRPEEASQTTWPPVILIVVGYFLASVALADPGSRVAVIGSMLPFAGPMVMYTRIVMGSAPVWQILASVGVSLVTAWLTLLLAERVYRGSLLRTRRTGWFQALRPKGA